LLTSNFLGDLVLKDKDLMLFFPDNVKFKSVPRDWLLSVIYHVKPDMYKDLVRKRDREIEKKNFANFDQFSVFIT
jgi:hypothetical protein